MDKMPGRYIEKRSSIHSIDQMRQQQRRIEASAKVQFFDRATHRDGIPNMVEHLLGFIDSKDVKPTLGQRVSDSARSATKIENPPTPR